MSDVLQVPRECGQILAVPTLHDLCDRMRRRAAPSPTPAGLRGEARRTLLSLAAEQTSEMDGAPLASVDSERPLLVSGHQPNFYHTGIWIKNFIVDAVCRHSGATGLQLVVDADVPTGRGIFLPHPTHGVWQKQAVVFPGIRLGVPWEAQPPLDAASWREVFSSIRVALPAPLRDRFEAYVACVLASSATHARSLGDSLARARRAWEGRAGRPSYLELTVSSMCGTQPFYRFICDILTRLPEYWQKHNACLQDYRARRGIRSDANPVPDLRRRDDLWETPFWCVHPTGERGGLFLERDGKVWKVMSKDTTFGALRDGEEVQWPVQLQALMVAGRAGIRPRALTLTMFVRLLVADVFLHGVGGAHYERVGDDLMQRFFGQGGAPYAVASATFCLEVGERDGEAENPIALRQRLREFYYNPQRFIPNGDLPASQRKLILVYEIGRCARQQKKAFAVEIARANAELRTALADIQRDLRRRLDAAERAAQQEEVVRWRGYPYFLFEPDELRRTVDAVMLTDC